MKLLYFAWLRTRIGKSEEFVDLPVGIDTVGDLIAWLRGRGDGYARALCEGAAIRIAVNRDYAGLECRLSAGDEVALFPPVTGG